MTHLSSLPPGPRGLPWLGNLLQFERDTLGFLMDVQRRYGRLATIRYGQTPIVVLFEPEHIRYVLAERPQNFTNGGVAGGLVYGKLLRLALMTKATARNAAGRLKEVVGPDGLITGDGEHHDRMRLLIQPALSKRAVASSAEIITAHAEELIR